MIQIINPTVNGFEDAISLVEQRLGSKGQTLEQAICERNLYFRVSLLGGCNLRCAFCHNEGAPNKGTIDKYFCYTAIKCASNLGFKRIQFTGGEPLLHPQVEEFVSEARNSFGDVGVTTNGTYIDQKLDRLIEAGITRIHISLQAEALRDSGSTTTWGVPVWLKRVLVLASNNLFILRLNLPVPSNELKQAKAFLSEMALFGNDIQVFSILPSSSDSASYPLDLLELIVREENHRRHVHRQRGSVTMRGYRPPTGFRCTTCSSYKLCREQSHSLRLGADHILRPCLATRQWDIPATNEYLDSQMRQAALLALDYTW